MASNYTNLKKLSEKNGEIEFQAEVPVDHVERYVLRELSHYAAELSLPGFRKGKVPDNLVREHVGEMELLEGAADEALREAMQQIVADESLEVIGRPQLTLMKLAPKNPIEFKIRFALAPEISLPDYKKIGKTVAETEEDLSVSEEETGKAVARIREISGMGAPAAEAKDGGKAELPPLTDDDVKKFGPFKTVAEFKAEIKRNLAEEKVILAKDRKREEMIKQIIAHAKVKVPAMLVEQELYEFLRDRDEQLASAGLSLEEYLKQTGKTSEALEKEERTMIENDIKSTLVIQAIRKKESLAPEEREVQVAIARLKLRYPDRSEDALRRTAEAMVLQEKLFEMLEGSAKDRADAEKADK